MASFSGDAEGSTEDIPERKKSKLKSLKSRLFGRSKRGSSKKNPKLSHSESDITTEKGLGLEEDLGCSQGMMPSRALSHDSIFIDDQVLTEAEPTRVSSQENVQGRIKALQMKLQQQKMHLGPPPLVLPIRRPEDSENRSDEENLSGSPLETSTASPLSSQPKPSPTKYALPTPGLPPSVTVTANSSVDESPSDFSSPAQLTPRLDTSAARHRMSVKPKNQRAGSKKKIGDAEADFSSNLDTLNNIDHDSDSDKEQQPCHKGEVALEKQEETVSPISSQVLPPKLPEKTRVISELETKSVSVTSSQQDQTLPETAPSILRAKTHRTRDAVPTERPHSCLLPSEMKDKRDKSLEIEVMCQEKKNPGTIAGEEVVLRSSSVQQQLQGETESTSAIKRPTQGSGSFHLSISTAKDKDAERPRSGSFAGVLEKTEGRHRYEKKPIVSMKEREELRELQLRGANANAGRLRQEAAQQKSASLLWDKRESLKKVEPVTVSASPTIEAAAVKVEEVKAEAEKQEVKEEDSKTAFGVKLRSTSQMGRNRSEPSSKAPVGEEQSDKQKVQETSSNTSSKSVKMSTDIPSAPVPSADLRKADLTPSGVSSSVKKTPSSSDDPRATPTEVKTTPKGEPLSINPQEIEAIPAPPQEPPPIPQLAEVSWMSMAMEKTKTLHQLFTRFPKDFSGAPARPQTPPASPAPTPPVMQTQTVKTSAAPPEATKSVDTIKAETAESKSQAQGVKPSVVAAQQKTSLASPVKSNIPKEPPPPKQTSQPQPHLTTATSAPHSAVKPTNPPTTQPPVQSIKAQNPSQSSQSLVHPATKTPNTSHATQGGTTQSLAQSYLSTGQQQPLWSIRGPQSTNQLKSTAPASSVSTAPPAAAPPQDSVSGGEEKEKEKENIEQEKGGAPLSVSERAAFLEKRAERMSSPTTKGVELRKAQTEAQTSGEAPASAKTAPLIKESKPEGRQWVRPAESSPTKISDSPREDKWLRKNVSSPARSMSPTMPTPLQAMSDSGQPSWMELAKRKSMAWSDKSMD